MRWPWRRQVTVDRDRTRAEREAAERRLEAAQAEIIRPLREMHRENHIGPLLDRLVQRAADRRTGRA